MAKLHVKPELHDKIGFLLYKRRAKEREIDALTSHLQLIQATTASEVDRLQREILEVFEASIDALPSDWTDGHDRKGISIIEEEGQFYVELPDKPEASGD